MNPGAIELYRERAIDVATEPLEIAVCAQHNNGGLRGNLWWETSVNHLFAIGELNGSHGIRPGGTALNAGQVGGLRAAQYIANVYTEPPMAVDDFLRIGETSLARDTEKIKTHLHADATACAPSDALAEIQGRMTENAGIVRSEEGVGDALSAAKALMKRIRREGLRIEDRAGVPAAMRVTHLCLAHLAFLEAITSYVARGGGSRGSYLIVDANAPLRVRTPSGEILPHRDENPSLRDILLEVVPLPQDEFEVAKVPVRPLPQDDSWFESVWREWREGGIFRAEPTSR